MELIDKIPQWVWFIIVPIVLYGFYLMLRGRDWSFGKFQAKIPKDETTVKAKNANTGTNYGHIGDLNYSPTYNISTNIKEDRKKEAVKFSDEEKVFIKNLAASEQGELSLVAYSQGFVFLLIDGSKEMELDSLSDCRDFIDRLNDAGFIDAKYSAYKTEYVLNKTAIDRINEL